MSTIKDGGPAFPRSGFEADIGVNGQADTVPQDGMTLRDYFAINATDADVAEFMLVHPIAPGQMPYIGRTRTEARWKFADAMLAAREAQP